MSGYTHLTREERYQIFALKRAGVVRGISRERQQLAPGSTPRPLS